MLETDILATERASKTTLIVSWNSADKREWHSSTIIGSTDRSIARTYESLADSLRWGKNGRSKTSGWKTVPGVQLRGKYNHHFTNLSKDDWANWMEDTVSLSTAVWKWRTDVTKFLRIHTLYSPLIEQLSIHWRYDRTCCLMLSELISEDAWEKNTH